MLNLQTNFYRCVLLSGCFLLGIQVSGQVECAYYYSFDQYYPTCDDHSVPQQKYVFENGAGKVISSNGLSGTFSDPGFRLNRYRMILQINAGPEVSTGYFSYDQGEGIRSDYFYINQNYYTCYFKGTNSGKIDDPVYIDGMAIDPALGNTSAISHSPFSYNLFSKPAGSAYLKPLLQYSSGLYPWKDVNSDQLEKEGGTVSINPAAFLSPEELYKDVRFRILKRVGDVYPSYSYGNISAPAKFYDSVTVKIVSGGNIRCRDSGLPLGGGYKHFPLANPDAFLEIKAAGEPETAWKLISKKLTTSITLFYSDIYSDSAHLGKELLLRPYKLFNGNKIYGKLLHLMFLPEMQVRYTATAPACHQGTDGKIQLDFPQLEPLLAKPVPIWITIYKYDKYPLADTGVFYKPVTFPDGIYYFNSGLTIQTSLITNSYLLQSGTYNNQSYLLGAGIYRVKAGFLDSAFCLREYYFRLQDPPKLESIVSSVYSWGRGLATYQVRTGENLASVHYVLTGGTRPYSYKVNAQTNSVKVSDSSGYIGLSPGSNNIVFLDAHACISSSTIQINKPPDMLISNVNTATIACHLSTAGDHGNGEINFSVSGGVPPYKAVLYRAGSAIKNIYPCESGTTIRITGPELTMSSQYQVYITDTSVNSYAPYIKKSVLLNIGQPPALLPTMQIIPALCDGNKGRISITATGGTGTKQYAVGSSGFQSESNFQVEPGKTHSVTVRDANGCTISLQANVPPSPPALQMKTSLIPPSCATAANGSITLTASGGTPFQGNLYQLWFPAYSFSPILTGSVSKAGLPVSIFPFELTDQNGCVLQDSIQLNASLLPPSFASVLTTDESCEGKKNGSLQIQYFSGERSFPPFEYEVRDGAGKRAFNQTSSLTSLNPGGFSSGNYTVYVRDAAGCTDTDMALVRANPNPIRTTLTSLKNAICPGTQTAAFTLSASGGMVSAANYLFRLYDSTMIELKNYTGGSFSQSNLATGLYSVSATDDSACMVKKEIRLISNPSPVRFVTLAIEDQACTGINNGYFKLRVFSSAGIKIQQISLPALNFLASNRDTAGFYKLISGTYQLHAIDQQGCKKDTTILLGNKHNEPVPQILFIDSLPCHESKNGKLFLSASAPFPKPFYRFSWHSEESNQIHEMSSDTVLISSLTHGNLYLKVSDSDGCSTEKTIVMPVSKDSVRFLISDFRTAPCEEMPGACFVIRKKGGYGKSDWTSYRLLDENQMHLLRSGAGGREVKVDSLLAGRYQLLLEDSNACKHSEQLILNAVEAMEISKDIGYVKAKGKCTASAALEIKKGNACFDYQICRLSKEGEEMIIAQGRTSHFILLDSLSAAEYAGYIMDTAGCLYKGSAWLRVPFKVNEPDSFLTVYFENAKPVACHGYANASFQLRGSGGWGNTYLYSLDNKNFIPRRQYDNLNPGIYNAYVQDTSGNVSVASIQLQEPDSLKASADSCISPRCFDSCDGAIKLHASGGSPPYELSADSAEWTLGLTLNHLPGGYHRLFVRDKNRCLVKVTGQLDAPAPIELLDEQLKPARCKQKGGRIEVWVAGGIPSYRYHWTGDSLEQEGASSIENVYSGIYKLNLVDSNQCSKEYTFVLSDSSSLHLEAFESTAVSCYGFSDGTARVKADSGMPPYSYTWSGVDGTYEVRGLREGSGLLKVKDSMGCALYHHFHIGSPDSLAILSAKIKEPSCSGKSDGSIDIMASGGTAPYRFLWSNMNQPSDPEKLPAGIHFLTLQDQHGCTLLESFKLNNIREVHSELGNDIRLCAGNRYLLDAGVYPLQIWYRENKMVGDERYLLADSAGLYKLEIEDEQGCIGCDSIRISYSSTRFNASLLAASTIGAGDTLILLETSWPVPDSIHWDADGADFLASTPWSRLISFQDTGHYELRITGYYGDCIDTERKPIRVISSPDKKEESGPGNKTICSFKAFPNPVQYILTIQLNLADERGGMIRISNVADGKTIWIREVKGTGSIEIPINVQDYSAGFYSIQLIAGEEKRSILFCIP